MFHIWYMFFDSSLLDSMYRELNLDREVSPSTHLFNSFLAFSPFFQMFTNSLILQQNLYLKNEDWDKITNFKRNFEPDQNLIPACLIREGRFRCGSDQRQKIMQTHANRS